LSILKIKRHSLKPKSLLGELTEETSKMQTTRRQQTHSKESIMLPPEVIIQIENFIEEKQAIRLRY
jgi:hypothetical protein